MPPKWPRKPDRDTDLAYRRLADRMNFAVHVAAFTAVNSIFWFVHLLKVETFAWVQTFSLIWLVGLVAHGVYVFAIATYPDVSPAQSDSDA